VTAAAPVFAQAPRSTLPPRAVLVHRRTELTELLQRHGTRGQAEFFLQTRGRRLEDVEARHRRVMAAIAAVAAAVPGHWRRGQVERAELSRFIFEPGDVVVVVGQDGLVANVAKYLDGQPVVGINPEPDRNPGVLVRHPPARAGALLATAAGPAAPAADALSMVQAKADDEQRLLALNEIFIGHASHQTARYSLTPPGGAAEQQASSGVIISTGTGATGWCRSAWLERHSQLALPSPADRHLTWFVREAWPSPATGTKCTEGELADGQSLTLTVISDQLVLFGDGVESDSIGLSAGQSVAISLASRTLSLVR
jgi:NAD kinase